MVKAYDSQGLSVVGAYKGTYLDMGLDEERWCVVQSGQFDDLRCSTGGGLRPVQQRGYPTSRLGLHS